MAEALQLVLMEDALALADNIAVDLVSGGTSALVELAHQQVAFADLDKLAALVLYGIDTLAVEFPYYMLVRDSLMESRLCS